MEQLVAFIIRFENHSAFDSQISVCYSLTEFANVIETMVLENITKYDIYSAVKVEK